ncbi:MAG: hypothetical protein RL687_446 [Candidatus Parcubacteria bacterium]|jgi:aspartate kinase
MNTLNTSSRPTDVFKLGGDTAGHPPFIVDLSNYFGNSNYENRNTVIVCSAFGGVTKNIDAIFEIINTPELSKEKMKKHISSWLNQFKRTHENIIKIFFYRSKKFKVVNADFMSSYKELESFVDQALDGETRNTFLRNDDERHSYLQACMLKYGEICSTKILSHYLDMSRFNFVYIDSRSFMKTNFKKKDDNSVKYDHNDVEIDFEETSRLIKQKFEGPFREGKIVICSGFIAQDVNTGDDTTLGYDGSDYTGAVISSVLKAAHYSLFKAEEGLMSDDPKVDPGAYLINDALYSETIDMCEKNGRWPIRRDALELCRDSNTIMYLRPSSDVKSRGSRIHN